MYDFVITSYFMKHAVSINIHSKNTKPFTHFIQYTH